MPQEDPKWEICQEAEKVVMALHKLYPDKLGHFDPKAIGCCAITNKEPPKSQSWDSKIKGIKEPEALYCSKQYVIMFFKKTWDSYTPSQRSAMLMRDLLRIGDEADGQVMPESLKDNKELTKAYGVDYLQNPNLPDLASVRQNF